jgi:hypothetical protein
MSAPKHTPGPWIVDNGVSEDITGRPTLGIYAAGPEEYGYVCGIHCGPDADITKQDYVNAHLIAAAPAMYEALKAVQDMLVGRGLISHDPDMNALFNMNAQALAQADGER